MVRSVVRTIRSAVPGPAQPCAHRRGHARRIVNGASSRWLPLVLGTVGALISGATLFGQLERGLNRIYGVEQDRPSAAEVRPRVAPHRHRRCVLGGCVRGVRIWPRDRFLDRLGGAHGLGHRALAGRARADRRGDGAAVPVVSAPPPTGVVVARVRVGAVGRAVVRVHTRVGPDVPRQLVRSVTPTVRSRASSRSRSGRCSRRSASSTELRSPRSSRPYVRASPRSRIRTRSTTFPRSPTPTSWSPRTDQRTLSHCRDGIRRAPAAHGSRRQSVHPRASRHLHEGRRRARLPGAGGQRPPGVLAAVARWPDRAQPRCWSTPGR